VRRRDLCRRSSSGRRSFCQGSLRLYEADARDVLPSLPTGSVDLILTDPPYHLATRGETYFRSWFTELPDDAWPPLFDEFFRVLAPNRHAYVFADARVQPLFATAARAAGFRVRAPLVWDKLAVGLGWCWRSQYEFIGWYTKGSRAGRRRDLGNVLGAPRVRGGYPTEKPLSLLSTIIEQASSPGELVLDPFCGSGNTGHAARRLGRSALLADVTADEAARRLGAVARTVRNGVPA